MMYSFFAIFSDKTEQVINVEAFDQRTAFTEAGKKAHELSLKHGLMKEAELQLIVK
jgi:hypothetical protein